MSDAWEEIQALKIKRNSLRERLKKRKQERQDILESSLVGTSSPVHNYDITTITTTTINTNQTIKDEQKQIDEFTIKEDLVKVDPELEKELLSVLNEVTLQIPITSLEIVASIKVTLNRHASHRAVCNLLQKFATQKLINIKDVIKDGRNIVEIHFVEHSKLNAMVNEETDTVPGKSESLKRKFIDSPEKCNEEEDKRKKEKKDSKTTDIMVQF